MNISTITRTSKEKQIKFKILEVDLTDNVIGLIGTEEKSASIGVIHLILLSDTF